MPSVARRGGTETGSLGLTLNGIALSVGTMMRLGIGFLTWLVAARLYSTTQVGLSAAVISAMFICVQVGMLGVDLALIALLPDHRDDRDLLLDTAIVLGTAFIVVPALVFVGLSAAGLHSLRLITHSPADAVLFLALTVLMAVWWLLDQAAVALRRSDQVVAQATLGAAAISVGVGGFGLAGWRTGSAILTSWVIAASAASALGFVQVSRAAGGYRFRPRLSRPLVRRLLSVGVPNFAMTAADTAPGLILPIVTAQVISPRVAAVWYVVWMMSLAAYTIPQAFALNVFAAASADPEELARHVREALRVAVALAAAATLALEALGPLVLSVLGHTYASIGSTPLRITALVAAPMAVGKVYLSVCRTTGRMREGTAFAAVVGVLAVALGAAAASAVGLAGVATAWGAVTVIAAALAGVRLRRLVQMARPPADLAAPGAG